MHRKSEVELVPLEIESEKTLRNPKKVILMKEMPYSAWPRGFYSQPLIQNTKTTKRKYYNNGAN